jgi:hypothetical protein
MNEETTSSQERADRMRRPRFALYHANGKGTGCALKLELHPAHDFVDGSIMAQFAKQSSVGGRDGASSFARFDWENAICVKLDFSDISKMLQVFCGECESIEDGKGLFHRSQKATTRIAMRHLVEPVQGYSLEVYRTPMAAGESESSARIMFSNSEALGITRVLEKALVYVCFGIPVVIPRNVQEIPTCA